MQSRSNSVDQPLYLRPRLVIRPEESPDLWQMMSSVDPERIGVAILVMLNRLVAYEKMLPGGLSGQGFGRIDIGRVESSQSSTAGGPSPVEPLGATATTPGTTADSEPKETVDPVDGLLSAFGPAGLSGFVTRPSDA